MKQAVYSLTLIFIVSLLSCKQGEWVTNRPAFSVRNTDILEIDKIVQNDTATIFYIDAFYSPKYWIKISGNSHLEAEGKSYSMTKAEGIKPDGHHWMPESGKSSFQLFFPPLPRSVKRVDLIEENCEQAFNIWGIELRQGAGPALPKLPEAAKNLPASSASTLAEPEFKIGLTKLNIHLLNFREGMDLYPVKIIHNEILTGEQREYEISPDTNLICRFEFDQYNTSPLSISYNRTSVGKIVTAPGDELDMWLDLGTISQIKARHKGEKTNPTGYVAGGKYMALNNSIMKGMKFFRIFPENFTDSILNMSTDQYLNAVMNCYHLTLDSIYSDPDLSGEMRAYQKAVHQDAVLAYISRFQRECEARYRISHNIDWSVREIDYQVPEFKPEQLTVLKELGINDPLALYSQSFPFHIGWIFRQYPTAEKLQELLGTDKGLLFDLRKIQGIGDEIANMEPLTEERQANLASVSNKFYSEAFAHMQEQIQAKINAAKQKTGYTICEIPEASDDKLFDAIIEKYKGKVILIDYWATWCDPCRSAMKMTEPLKKELKDLDIVYVYLTGESSPVGTWMEMIPDIKGEHYRLPQKQWDAVTDKFGIDGIPSYVLVDKTGKPTLRKDFPDINKMKKVLSEESKK